LRPGFITDETVTALRVQALDVIARVKLPAADCGLAGLTSMLTASGSMVAFAFEALVKTHNAGSITRGDGTAEKVGAWLTSVWIGLFEPRRKGRVRVNPLAPTWELAIKRRLNISVLRSRCHLLQVLVLRPQLLEFRSDGIVGGASGEVQKFRAIVLFVLTGECHSDCPEIAVGALPYHTRVIG
jgi:hypothetical protein